jgi:ATP-dependent protease ClpP protease subunit
MVSYINIYGVIGEDILAQQVIEAIQYYQEDKSTTDLIVNLVDTPGGYSSQGNAIYDALERFKTTGKKLTTRGSGFVGSISTVIFCAGQVRELTASTVFYVHNAQLRPNLSNSEDLRKAADYLDNVTEQAARVYGKVTPLSPEDISYLMSEEIYLSAEDAKTLGFATYVNNFNEVLLKNEQFMTSFKDRFKTAFGKEGKGGKEEGGAVALALNLTDGRLANISTVGDVPKKGDAITVNGSTLEDGSYKTQNGYSLTVANGVLSEVSRSEVSNETLLQAIQLLREENKTTREELESTQEALLKLARSHVSNGFKKPGAGINPGGEKIETPVPAPKLEGKGMRATMEAIREKALAKRNA